MIVPYFVIAFCSVNPEFLYEPNPYSMCIKQTMICLKKKTQKECIRK